MLKTKKKQKNVDSLVVLRTEDNGRRDILVSRDVSVYAFLH